MLKRDGHHFDALCYYVFWRRGCFFAHQWKPIDALRFNGGIERRAANSEI